MKSNNVVNGNDEDVGFLSLVSVVFFGSGLAAWSFATRPVEYNHGGIVCSEVRRLAPDYLNGELDEDVSNKIAVHLGLCPTCGPTKQEMEESMHVSGTPCSDPGCEHCAVRVFVASAEDVQAIVIDGHF